MSLNLEKYSEAGKQIDLTRKACKCPFATLFFCYPLLEGKKVLDLRGGVELTGSLAK